MVYPKGVVRFVYGHNLYQRSAGIAALNMQWPSSSGKPKDQTSGTIFIIGVCFDYLALVPDGLFNLSNEDTPDNGLVNSMFWELVLALTDLVPNLVQHRHCRLFPGDYPTSPPV
jgi:hypothetical protein